MDPQAAVLIIQDVQQQTTTHMFHQCFHLCSDAPPICFPISVIGVSDLCLHIECVLLIRKPVFNDNPLVEVNVLHSALTEHRIETSMSLLLLITQRNETKSSNSAQLTEETINQLLQPVTTTTCQTLLYVVEKITFMPGLWTICLLMKSYFQMSFWVSRERRWLLISDENNQCMLSVCLLGLISLDPRWLLNAKSCYSTWIWQSLSKEHGDLTTSFNSEC